MSVIVDLNTCPGFSCYDGTPSFRASMRLLPDGTAYVYLCAGCFPSWATRYEVMPRHSMSVDLAYPTLRDAIAELPGEAMGAIVDALREQGVRL